MLKSWDPGPCKEYWIQALTPTSASVAPTLSNTLLTGRSSGIEAVYTACRDAHTHQRKKGMWSVEWNDTEKYCCSQWLHLHLAKSNKSGRPTTHLKLFVIVFNHHCGCIFHFKSATYGVIHHLVTDGAVVIGVYHCHFHRCLGNKESITCSDIDDVEVAFFPVEQPLHIHLPFTLNQAQRKHTTIVATWTTQRQTSRWVKKILEM